MSMWHDATAWRQASGLLLFAAIIAYACYVTRLGWRMSHSIAPAAFERWLTDRGFRLTRKRPAKIFPRLLYSCDNTQVLYWFEAIDASGKVCNGYARCGSMWITSLSVDRCPVRVFWSRTDKKPVHRHKWPSDSALSLWDRDVDASSPKGRA